MTGEFGCFELHRGLLPRRLVILAFGHHPGPWFSVALYGAERVVWGHGGAWHLVFAVLQEPQL